MIWASFSLSMEDERPAKLSHIKISRRLSFNLVGGKKSSRLSIDCDSCDRQWSALCARESFSYCQTQWGKEMSAERQGESKTATEKKCAEKHGETLEPNLSQCWHRKLAVWFLKFETHDARSLSDIRGMCKGNDNIVLKSCVQKNKTINPHRLHSKLHMLKCTCFLSNYQYLYNIL